MLTEKFWDRYFAVYDVLNELYPYQELLDTFIQTAGNLNGKKVLDAGAGTGNLSKKIKEGGGEVFAIDISSAGTRLLLEKIPEANSCIGSLCETLPYNDNFFDFVVSNNVIYTLPEKDRPSVVKEFYRVLKPGGKIIVSNISPGFSPIKIYLSHISKELQKSGFLMTMVKIVKFIPPTIKMFVYNAKINRENSSGEYVFLDEISQKHFLELGGFSNISPGIRLYGKQAVLHSALKHEAA